MPEVDVALGAVRSRRRTESGAAALEFALVIPFLLVLVFGLIQWGLYFWAYQAGADAARQAARSAAVGDYPTTADCPGFKTEIRDALSDQATNTAVVTRKFTYDVSNTTGQVQPGDLVTVTVEYDTLNFNFPFVPFVGDGQVSQTAQARVEFTGGKSLQDCP